MIDLTYSEIAATEDHSNYAVTMSATWTEDDSVAKIFVLQESSDLTVAEFSCVASAIQLDDLPEDAPTEDTSFYRVNSVSASFLTPAAAAEFIEKTRYAVTLLVTDLSVLENTQATTITIEP